VSTLPIRFPTKTTDSRRSRVAALLAAPARPARGNVGNDGAPSFNTRPFGSPLCLATCFAIAATFAATYANAHLQEPAASDSRSVWDGVYSDDQAKRGEPVYHKECATCHGDSLAGGESAPPLSGGGFLSNWDGLTLGDLFDRIRKSMPQNAPGKLTKQQVADVLAYALSVNKFPAGKSELSKQVEFLREIRFEANKPEPQK
jgi:S-disulfanyl-L-cysteine oxidoreductase SoxD